MDWFAFGEIERLMVQGSDYAGSGIETMEGGKRPWLGLVFGLAFRGGLVRGFGFLGDGFVMRRRRKIAIWGGVAYFDKFVGLKFGASGVDLLLPSC